MACIVDDSCVVEGRGRVRICPAAREREASFTPAIDVSLPEPRIARSSRTPISARRVRREAAEEAKRANCLPTSRKCNPRSRNQTPRGRFARVSRRFFFKTARQCDSQWIRDSDVFRGLGRRIQRTTFLCCEISTVYSTRSRGARRVAEDCSLLPRSRLHRRRPRSHRVIPGAPPPLPRALAPPPPAPGALRATLISSRLSTGVRQMGHRLLWCLSILAHPEHMHMCLHGSTVVSRVSLRHTTHSFPDSPPSSPHSPCSLRGTPALQFSMPKISWSSYDVPSTQIFCFSTVAPHDPSSFFTSVAYVVCDCTHSARDAPAGSGRATAEAFSFFPPRDRSRRRGTRPTRPGGRVRRRAGAGRRD